MECYFIKKKERERENSHKLVLLLAFHVLFLLSETAFDLLIAACFAAFFSFLEMIHCTGTLCMCTLTLPIPTTVVKEGKRETTALPQLVSNGSSISHNSLVFEYSRCTVPFSPSFILCCCFSLRLLLLVLVLLLLFFPIIRNFCFIGSSSGAGRRRRRRRRRRKEKVARPNAIEPDCLGVLVVVMVVKIYVTIRRRTCSRSVFSGLANLGKKESKLLTIVQQAKKLLI